MLNWDLYIYIYKKNLKKFRDSVEKNMVNNNLMGSWKIIEREAF